MIYRTYILLRGSSSYDTREMSVLIAGVIDDCKDAEIPECEIMTPDEKEELLKRYGITVQSVQKKRGKLWSVFTEDMDHCMMTGRRDVERHHIFSHTPKMRKLSEEYGFIAPLWKKIHPNGVYFDSPEEYRDIDLRLKQMCQRYYEENIGSREKFRKEFYKSYL